MKKQNLKLALKKEIIASLSKEASVRIVGGTANDVTQILYGANPTALTPPPPSQTCHTCNDTHGVCNSPLSPYINLSGLPECY